jgi:SAM-dependent methyltransferase
VRQIVRFANGAGVKLTGAEIADVGCGDGIMALGVTQHVKPRKLVGFDVVPTNCAVLVDRARQQRVATSLPHSLEFRHSEPERLPAADASFDFAYSWSAFEHIAAPLEMLQEIRRILRPTGAFFLQLWPFYFSPQGSHLEDWFPDGFQHLLERPELLIERARASSRHPPEWTEIMVREYERLNRITLADLQEAVLSAGFEPLVLELLPDLAQLSPGLNGYPWADLGIGGIKLLAGPARG